MKYCYKNGKLRLNSTYFYQGQALLEITNRSWCDFVIYTKKGTHIERIHRSKGFWKNTLPKLKAFFYYYLVPSLVQGSVNEDPIKWTTIKDLEILDNGLVNDCHYYLQKCNKSFYMGFYSNARCDIPEIRTEDFFVLSGTEWLSNFIVDICFNIFNRDNIFNFVPVSLSTLILFEGNHNNYILDKIQIFYNDTLTCNATFCV